MAKEKGGSVGNKADYTVVINSAVEFITHLKPPTASALLMGHLVNVTQQKKEEDYHKFCQALEALNTPAGKNGPVDLKDQNDAILGSTEIETLKLSAWLIYKKDINPALAKEIKTKQKAAQTTAYTQRLQISKAEEARAKFKAVFYNPPSDKVEKQHLVTALHWSASNGNHTLATEIITQHGDIINEKGKGGQTIVHFAVKSGKPEFLAKILNENQDLDIQARDDQGKTALMWAVESGNVEMVKALIAEGADPNIQTTTDKLTALHMAEGKPDIQKILIQAGADKNLENSKGYAPEIDHAISADPTIKPNTPLLNAVRSQDPKKVVRILDRMIKMDPRPKIYDDALISAICEWTTIPDELATTLVEKCYSVNEQDQAKNAELLGSFILYSTVNKNNIVITATQNKIEATAYNFTVLTLSGKDPLMYAIEKEHTDLAKWLINRDEIKLKLDVQQDANKKTALMYAIEKGQSDIVQALIAAKPNLNLRDQKEKTALMLAVESGNVKMVQALIAAKPDLNLQDKENKTALMYAIEKGQSDIVQALITAQPNLNLQDKTGKTALMYAIEKGQSDIVQALITGGANLNITDFTKDTALVYAILRDNTSMIRTLLNNGAYYYMAFGNYYSNTNSVAKSHYTTYFHSHSETCLDNILRSSYRNRRATSHIIKVLPTLLNEGFALHQPISEDVINDSDLSFDTTTKDLLRNYSNDPIEWLLTYRDPQLTLDTVTTLMKRNFESHLEQLHISDNKYYTSDYPHYSERKFLEALIKHKKPELLTQHLKYYLPKFEEISDNYHNSSLIRSMCNCIAKSCNTSGAKVPDIQEKLKLLNILKNKEEGHFFCKLAINSAIRKVRAALKKTEPHYIAEHAKTELAKPNVTFKITEEQGKQGINITFGNEPPVSIITLGKKEVLNHLLKEVANANQDKKDYPNENQIRNAAILLLMGAEFRSLSRAEKTVLGSENHILSEFKTQIQSQDKTIVKNMLVDTYGLTADAAAKAATKLDTVKSAQSKSK